MKNKVFKLVTMCLVCIMLYAMPVFASEEEDYIPVPPVSVQSVLLPPNIKSTRVRMNPLTRGKYFNTAYLELYNPEPGVVGISVDIECSEAMEKIYVKVYLDVKNGGAWKQVKSWGFTTYDEMYNIQDFEVTGLKSGSSYRLRGAYSVHKNGESETGSAQTDGLQID